MERDILATNRKALRINLNNRIFGTLAEIGGGQEVARCFFQAGGASGTVAKSISAYDKAISDALYNRSKPERYVSEERLTKMLHVEFSELRRVLGERKGSEVCFFAFANTVETLNYRKDNEAHGWMGVRFELTPQGAENEVILHVRLLDNDTLQQQNALGILGINLIFACFHFHEYPNTFLQSLLDNLSFDRVEITMIRMSGGELSYVDNRLLAVQLVKNGMTGAVVFDRDGNIREPASFLYRKNVLVFRGSFRPITYVGFDMLRTSYAVFKKDPDYEKGNTLSLCEMTLNNLLDEGMLDERDFLARVDLLNGMGQNVMVSVYREFYKLVGFFSRFTIKNLRIVIGIPAFLNVLDKKYYADLNGGILEAMGKLFVRNLKLYVYPTLATVSVDDPTGSENLLTSENLVLSDDLKDLYHFLIKNRKIIDLKNAKRKWLFINTRRVLELIQSGDPDWEEMVPVYVKEQIKSGKLFGYSAGADVNIQKSTGECR